MSQQNNDINRVDHKSLQEFAVSMLEKNKTIFCIALAFSIFLYFQPIRIPFSHYFSQDGHAMTFECLSKKVNGYSATLLIIEIFLTAFAITRFLKMINIKDIILRTPFLCDLIFWLKYDDRMLMKQLKESNLQSKEMFDLMEVGYTLRYYKFHKQIDGKYNVESLYRIHKEDINRDHQENKLKKAAEIATKINILSFNEYGGYYDIRYVVLRFISIHCRGFFFEKTIKKYIIKKLKMKDEKSKSHKIYTFLIKHNKPLRHISKISLLLSLIYLLFISCNSLTITLLFSSFYFYLLCL